MAVMVLTFYEGNLVFGRKVFKPWYCFSECDEPPDVVLHPRDHGGHQLSSAINVDASCGVDLLVIISAQISPQLML